MTEQEIKETAKLMEEGNLDLVDWLDNRIDELMEKLRFHTSGRTRTEKRCFSYRNNYLSERGIGGEIGKKLSEQ